MAEQEPQSKFNLIDIAKGQLMSTRKEEKNLIIIGNKGSGKTTIFNSLTNIQIPQQDNYTQTSGINYGFMRYQQSSSKKLLLNIYEIGGGMENVSLLRSILNNDNFNETMIAIVLDFKKPKGQLDSLLKYIESIRAIIKDKISIDTLREYVAVKEAKYINKERLKGIKVFPANVIVIGNKYNILEKIDVDNLKWVCRVMRYFCCINSLSLMFYTYTDSKLNILLQSTITDYAFGQSKIDNISGYTQKNELKALYIPYYRDSLVEIGDPKVMQMSGADMNTLWVETYQTLFKKEDDKDDELLDSNNKKINDMLKDLSAKYKEPRIDNEKNIFDNIKEERDSKGKQSDMNKLMAQQEKRAKKKLQNK